MKENLQQNCFLKKEINEGVAVAQSPNLDPEIPWQDVAETNTHKPF